MGLSKPFVHIVDKISPPESMDIHKHDIYFHLTISFPWGEEHFLFTEKKNKKIIQFLIIIIITCKIYFIYIPFHYGSHKSIFLIQSLFFFHYIISFPITCPFLITHSFWSIYFRFSFLIFSLNNCQTFSSLFQ